VQQVMLFEAFLGLTSVVVIHHTGMLATFPQLGTKFLLDVIADCGASIFKNPDIRKFHKDRLPDHPEIDDMSFGAFEK
jgi:carbonic anhydrase